MSEPLKPEVTILNLAIELPAQQRAAYVARACLGDEKLRHQVEALLAAHEAADGFLQLLPGQSERSQVEGANSILSPRFGERIGRYKLLQQIGEGGCGVVYLAEQEEPVRRSVALKVVKVGMDTKSVIARFEGERQALAMMDHPNIARVFDAGATEAGRPYFVMELVRGVKITEFFQKEGLSIEDRLRLFVQVCHAIQHAHQKGVIHRDIKPSNILVTVNENPAEAGVPKVIDFGIAKATQQKLTDKTVATQLAAFIGTPAYMSPEQTALAGNDLDTRSDIYSLGVLLYELLTGVTPFDQEALLAGGLDEMRRTICEIDPPKPSTRNIPRSDPGRTASGTAHQVSPIPGDLDWIVMKCLEKDRGRRYATANALALDVQRYLNHEPVSARPPGQWYRFHKWVRRNRLAFVSLSVLLGALVIVSVGSTVAAWRVAGARRAEHDARQKAEAANVQLRGIVRLLELERAEDFFRDHDAAQGVAHLAAMLRQDPSNHIAASRLVSALVHRNWALAFAPPMRHLGPVECAEFSPDGRRVLSASRDGTIRIWDSATGQELATAQHGDRVLHAGFSPDGARFISASADGTARIWSVTNGASLTPSLVHTGAVSWAEFSADGKWVVTASSDRIAKVWDAATGALRQAFVGHSTPIVAAHFSPDARVVATANETGGQRIWNVESGRTLFEMNVRSRIHSLAFSPDGQRLVTGYEDGTARIWNSSNGLMVGEPVVHSVNRIPVWSAMFSRDGRLVVTSGEDGTAQLWNSENGQPVGPRLRHAAGVISAAFSPDGTRLVTSSADNSARVWEVRSGRPLSQPLRSYERILKASFSPDGARLVTASYAWTVQLWDIRSRAYTGLELASDDDISSVSFSPDGGTLLVAGEDRTARLWDVRSGSLLATPVRHSGPVHQAAFTPDGRRFATASTAPTTYVRDVGTGSIVSGPFEHSNGLRRVSFSPDGSRLVTASEDGTARVWDSHTAVPITPPLTHGGPVTGTMFSPDGRFVATASEDQTARVWDAQSGHPVSEPLRHRDHVRWVGFSPDGRRLLTASTDNTAGIWELPSGRRVGPALRHARIVEQAAFSPDGTRVATASLDRTARIWDARSGQSVTPPLSHDNPVTQVQFSPDGRSLLTACRDAARVWDAETGRPVTEWLRLRGWVLSATFDTTGSRVATGSKHARVWEAPPAPVPVPGWFIDLAEGVAGLHLDPRGNEELLPWVNLNLLAPSAPSGGTELFYWRLASWFLAEPGKREVSPFGL
jgi:WD40 repeat protein/serine/threonine protein kinase